MKDNQNFTLTHKQMEQIDEWMINHKHKQKDAGTIGGAFVYQFTPTGLGIIEICRCDICNEYIDVTDYEMW